MKSAHQSQAIAAWVCSLNVDRTPRFWGFGVYAETTDKIRPVVQRAYPALEVCIKLLGFCINMLEQCIKLLGLAYRQSTGHSQPREAGMGIGGSAGMGVG